MVARCSWPRRAGRRAAGRGELGERRDRGRARGRASRPRRRSRTTPSANGSSWTSPTRASTPRARVSSTMRGETVDRDDLARRARVAIRSASSPGPQPTSSTRRGATSATASNDELAGDPARRRSRSAERRAARLVSVAYCPPDDGGVVEPHGSTIGVPGMPAARRLAAEPGVHRRADVGELALVDRAAGVLALRVGEQQRVLARVVGRRRRRVAAVVGGEDRAGRPAAAPRGCRAAGGRSPAGSGGS